MEIVVVPQSQVKANKKAIVRMARWRQRYQYVTLAIRRSKDRLRTARRWRAPDREQMELATLEALRLQAFRLMEERTVIADELRETAYVYAPREMVA